MKQHINLHQPMFRRKRILFAAPLLLRGATAFVLILGVIYGLALVQAERTSAERRLLEARRQALQQELEASTRQLAGHARSAVLEQELARLREEKAQKLATLQVLAGGQLGNVEGFASYFEALARRRLDGLWLTRVQLGGGGRQVQLAGIAMDEKLLPRYLGELAREPVFQGLQFHSAAITRSAVTATEVRFELRTDEARGTR